MPLIRHDETGESTLGLTASALILDDAGRVLLIKENYGRRRYGLPGGTVEAGESPIRATVREAREEVGVEVAVGHLIGCYFFAWAEPWLAFVFRCTITQGEPAIPPTGEIAAVGWFDPGELPAPLTNVAPLAIADAVDGQCGVMREVGPAQSVLRG